MLKKTIPLVLCALSFCGLARAVDVSEVPNPLKRLKAGQWVTYRLMDNVEQKQTVMSVTEKDGDTLFVVKYETSDPNMDIPEITETHSAKTLVGAFLESLKDGTAKLSKVAVTANGKEYQAILVEIDDEEDGVLRTYLSEEIPITGIVKMEDDDEEDNVLLEVVAFGEN